MQAKRLVTRLRDETGQIVILAAPKSSLSAKALDKLELVFHRRVFVDAPSGFGLFGKLFLLKRRKGLIFIMAGSTNPNGNSVARRAAKLGLADQVLHSKGSLETYLQDLGLPADKLISDSIAIESIIDIQAAKTERAVARGATQTSGSEK